jgi:hypothetical protein
MTTTNDYRKLEYRLQTIDMSDLQGNLDDAILYFKNLRSEYEDKYETLLIKIDCGYDDDADELYLCGIRTETQADYERRLEIEAENKRREIERQKCTIEYAQQRLKELEG